MLPTLAAGFTVVVCGALGVWQIRRYGESTARSEEVLSAWRQEPIVGVPAEADPTLRYRRARVRGRWAEEEAVRFSGGSVGGEPGHQLVAVLDQEDGPPLLVDRGWVPMGLSREGLQALHEAGVVEIEGLLVPAEGRTDLKPTRTEAGALLWPLDTDRAYGFLPRALGPPFGAMVAASPRPLAPWVVRAGEAFEPDAHRALGALPVPGYVIPLPRTHHLSYAAQWFAFAGIALGLWAWASAAPSKE